MENELGRTWPQPARLIHRARQLKRLQLCLSVIEISRQTPVLELRLGALDLRTTACNNRERNDAS